MPLIHTGDSTHPHDQVMTPVNLSTTNVISAIWETALGTDSLLHCTLGRCGPIGMPDTPPAYGTGVGQCYGGKSAELPARRDGSARWQ